MPRRNGKSLTAFAEVDPLGRMNPLCSTFHDKLETETTEKRSGVDNCTDVGVQVASSEYLAMCYEDKEAM
jgi:hypothetical protein